MSLKLKHSLSRIDDFVYKYRYILLAILITAALGLSFGHVFAQGTTDVWQAGGALTDNLVTAITTFYVDKLFVLLLIVNVVLLAVIRDDKWTKTLTKSLFIICIVFIVCKGYNVITATLTKMATDAGLTT